MKRFFKFILVSLLTISILSSCQRDTLYRYRVTHLDQTVDTIAIDDHEIIISQKSEHPNALMNKCECQIYSYNVSKFVLIDVLSPTPAEISSQKEASTTAIQVLLLIFGSIAFIILFCVSMDKLARLRKESLDLKRYQASRATTVVANFTSGQNNKVKHGTMKTILRYTVYGFTIVLVFKIGMLLIKYLPAAIENHLK